MEFSLKRNLVLLMAASIVVQLFVAAALTPGYYLFSVLLGISSGYLALVSVAAVRNEEARSSIYSAVIATWIFWFVLSLWKNSRFTILDALISTFGTIVIYCLLCLGIAFYTRWQLTRNKYQFPLSQVFGLTAIVALVSVMSSTFPDAVPRVMRLLPSIVPAVTACVTLALTSRLKRFVGAMLGCGAVVIILYGLAIPNSELMIGTLSQWLMIMLGGVLLRQVPRDLEVSTDANTEAADNEHRPELIPESLDES